MRNLWITYKEIIFYLIFGVLTTFVNIVSYYIFEDMMHIHYLIANIFAWLLAVLFAYETNRRWVFESNAKLKKKKEFSMFISCRLFSGTCDMGVMYLGVDILSMNSFIIKVVSNVIVVVLNYIFSKFLIFKKDK